MFCFRVHVDTVKIEIVDFRHLADVFFFKGTRHGRGIGSAHVARFTKIGWNVRSVLQIARKLSVLDGQNDGFHHVRVQGLMVTVVTGRQLSVCASFP